MGVGVPVDVGPLQADDVTLPQSQRAGGPRSDTVTPALGRLDHRLRLGDGNWHHPWASFSVPSSGSPGRNGQCWRDKLLNQDTLWEDVRGRLEHLWMRQPAPVFTTVRSSI